MQKSKLPLILFVASLLLGLAVVLLINPSKGEVPRKALVAPGEHDEYYGFLSGGPGGDVRVVGIPSMRLVRRIPVFEPSMRYGYGVDKNGKADPSFGKYTWGDTHHPVLSQTKNDYDGRWLFINDKANGQVGKIDLKTFKTEKIIKIPTAKAIHGLAIEPTASKIMAGAIEFPRQLGGKFSSDPKQEMAGLVVMDPNNMSIKYQILGAKNPELDTYTSGYDAVIFSKDGKKIFTTMYNFEGSPLLAGMIAKDKDAVAVIDVELAEKAFAEGKYKVHMGIPVLIPEEIPNLVKFVPVPKNPHGVTITPDGKYAIAAGKLSPTVTIIDTKTLEVVAEPFIGLGPLHTTFDGKGNAYTSNFVDSQVVKWNVEKAIKGDKEYIVDKLDVHYNPGHTNATGGYTNSPGGDYLLSLNKLSKGRFLEVGPDLPENNQLIDISGDKMKLIYDAPADLEPHDAVFIRMEKLMTHK